MQDCLRTAGIDLEDSSRTLSRASQRHCAVEIAVSIADQIPHGVAVLVRAHKTVTNCLRNPESSLSLATDRQVSP